MQMKHADLVTRWFDGLNRGDLPGLLGLFADTVTIQNAANPTIEGPHAAKQLLEDFFQRTASRRFELIDMAEQGDEVFAGWTGVLLFRRGASVAGRVLRDNVEVELRGADWFKLNAAGRISELLIAHETTSVMLAVSKAA
jgi:ketosteroid isomerase-like protein